MAAVEVPDRLRLQAEALSEALRDWTRGMAHTLRERVPEARHRGEEVAGRLRERGGRLGRALRSRAPAVAERVRRRGERLAGRAAERGEHLAHTVRVRGPQVAERLREVERQIAALLRERERHLAEVLRERGEALREALERAEVSPRPAPSRRRRSAVRLVVNRYTIGFGAGYVLGARAGRERYEQIVQRWRSFTGNPTVQRIEARGREAAVRAGRGAAEAVRARFRPLRSVREVMTPVPRTVRSTATLVEAARSMREADAGAVIVVDDRDRVVGIVTDRDIAVRAVAEGRDPATTTVAQVASTDLTTLSPTDTVSHAARLMRERAIRRLPVVEGGRPVGIVSIADLAVARDRDSALAEISAAPPNR